MNYVKQHTIAMLVNTTPPPVDSDSHYQPMNTDSNKRTPANRIITEGKDYRIMFALDCLLNDFYLFLMIKKSICLVS